MKYLLAMYKEAWQARILSPVGQLFLKKDNSEFKNRKQLHTKSKDIPMLNA